MLVIDANIAISWLLQDGSRQENAYAQACLEDLQRWQAVMPALWQLEVVNILSRAEREGRVSEADVSAFLSLLGALPIVFDVEVDMRTVAGVARQHRLTAYDAACLDVAQRHGATLATQDKALRRAAQAAGVPLFAALPRPAR